MAQERGFDLVEVAPMASPPVVRFLDFGQFKYEQTKRDKDAKRRSRVGFKEVRLTPKIGSGDFTTKVHRAIEFLEDGDRIKVTVRFRGRELTHPELGRNLLTKFTEAVKEHATVERAPILEGKSMFAVLASTHKPKIHEHGRPAEGRAPEAAAAVEERRPEAAAAVEERRPEAAAAVEERRPEAASAVDERAPEAAAAVEERRPQAGAAAPAASNGEPAQGTPPEEPPSRDGGAAAPRPTPPTPPVSPGAEATPPQ